MRTLIITILVSFWVLTSCRQETNTGNQKAATHKNTFTFHRYDIDLDTSIKDIEIFNKDIICLLDNGKIVVLDSNYRRNYEAEKRLSSKDTITSILVLKNYLICPSNKSTLVFDSLYHHFKRIENQFDKLGQIWMHTFEDTTWVWNEKKSWVLDDNLNLKYYSWPGPNRNRDLFQGIGILDDSTYSVYGCSSGEFGGNLFFKSKKNNIVTLCPGGSPTEAFYYKGAYVIIHTLAHMRGYSSYLRILDPSKLYKANTKEYFHDSTFCCNCDSITKMFRHLSDAAVEKEEKDHGINYYYTGYQVLTPVSFIEDNQLYSLQLNDSFTRIVLHTNDTIALVDTFPLSTANKFAHFFQKKTMGKIIYCNMNGNSWSINNDGGVADYISYSGILLVKGKKIDLIEYYKNTSSYK